MEKKVTLTTEGHQKLVDELAFLKGTKREEVKRNLAQARSFGDLSENSEYDEAKDEQAKTEARISEIEEMLRVCHKMAVLRDGAKVGEISGQMTQETVMNAIAGGGQVAADLGKFLNALEGLAQSLHILFECGVVEAQINGV